METDKPLLFFKDLKNAGETSIYATLKSVTDLVAKNKKPYLRLVLIDPFGRELLVQIWDDHEIYAPSNLFMRKNLLAINHPIHLIYLTFDGEFVSSSVKTKIDAIPTQHPIYPKYIQLNNYRLQRTIPEDPAILNEIKKLFQIKPLVEAILARVRDEGVEITENFFWEVTKLIMDKTYTGTIHLLMGNPQLTITPHYTNYVLKQLEILLIAFAHELTSERIAPIVLIQRLAKDLISLFEYDQINPK